VYSKQEITQTRQRFWTSFGQYMRPVKGATGDTINWLNYKTGVRHIYFRMDVTTTFASIGIELQHPDETIRLEYFNQFQSLRSMLESSADETWDWSPAHEDESGRMISRIGKTMEGVNLFRETDWPAIISFLKPRIIALDRFWSEVRDVFE
jgi:hypothetical protein